jgi:chromosome segregation ATPase
MTSRASFVIAVSILAVFCLVAGGCKGRELEKAEREARQAKATVATLELALAKHVSEISDLKAELNVVRQTRDELQERVDDLLAERNNASAVVQHAEQMITQLTARANGQASTTAALQKEITELKALVAEQQTVIEELQQGVAEGRITGETSEALGEETTDPNAPPKGGGDPGL